MQGYLKSKPLPADEATRFLEANVRRDGDGKPTRKPLTVVT
jgi:hypothetical protein